MKSENMSWRRRLALYVRGLRLIARYMPGFIRAITLHSVVSTVTPYVTVWLSAQIINALADTSNAQTLWMWVAVTVTVEVVLALLGGVLARQKEAKWDMLYLSVDTVLTDKMLSLDYADAEDRDVRDRLHRVRENMQTMGLGLTSLPDVYQSMLSGTIGMLCAMLLVWSMFTLPVPETAGTLVILNEPLCAVIMAAMLIVISVGASRLSQKAQQLSNRNMDEVIDTKRRHAPFFKVMTEAKRAADVRLYRQDRLVLDSLSRTDSVFYGKGGRVRRMHQGGVGVLSAVSSGVSALLMGAVYAFAAAKALGGAFGIGSVTQYVGALTRLVTDLSRLFWAVERLNMNTPYLQMLCEFLDIPHRMYQGSLSTEKRTDRDYEIEFRHVSFCYPSCKEYALKDVSLSFRIGSRLAIVGANGSGKSTFVKLLCRLYDPTEGEILLNGIDIRKYRFEEYAALFAVVFQDFELPARPIGENVAGNTTYDVDRVRRCLIEAGFDEDNIDVFKNCDALSGGEAQKVAMARALYKNAPFIVLDEPTASLDPVAEAEIYAGFDRVVGDKTAIYISHRMSGCRFCDEVLVFDQGRIVQRGAHEELVADPHGIYHALWNAQAQYYTG